MDRQFTGMHAERDNLHPSRQLKENLPNNWNLPKRKPSRAKLSLQKAQERIGTSKTETG